ncbi:hypothetical protein [Bradyrhizobium sp. CB3481]|uniref:hypothetical protein n=1 Tax=Bradyrhizobium sp. CB3481 TaxID=3039158 RepID=UPI0024B14D7A|nr:hypothetical protein [Bradyrhizobium sp. CB3481]WFU14867.1 hypothetical protein QA643_28030 [Bradyrhizobium sp. CB3481]
MTSDDLVLGTRDDRQYLAFRQRQPANAADFFAKSNRRRGLEALGRFFGRVAAKGKEKVTEPRREPWQMAYGA